MQPYDNFSRVVAKVPEGVRRRVPHSIRRSMTRLYWMGYDLRDFVAESIGWIPFHSVRLLLYRYMLQMEIGPSSSIHRGCRFYCPPGVRIGRHTVINRGVVLDGRSGLVIGDNASISEGTAVLTLEHDPQSPSFDERGGPVCIGDRVFVGARALVLPGVKIGDGAVVGAGAVVTQEVPPLAIVAGVPARVIGERTRDLGYTLNYRKFLG
jgi:acetyltransferase-like isoleucine patch superfamily enzyme